MIIAHTRVGINPESIAIRGHALIGDLIGSISFTEHVLIARTLPTDARRKILDDAMVATASQAARAASPVHPGN